MYSESLSGKPELLFMDQIDEVIAELQQIKGENAIIIRLKDGFKESKMIITNQVSTFDVLRLWNGLPTKALWANHYVKTLMNRFKKNYIEQSCYPKLPFYGLFRILGRISIKPKSKTEGLFFCNFY